MKKFDPVDDVYHEEKITGMKKLMVLLAIVALLGVAGCCTSPNNSNKNFANCVAKIAGPVKSILCPPNQEQVDQAAAAANFLSSLLGKDWSVQIELAKETFLNIAAGICEGLDQLQAAVNTFDNTAVVVTNQAKMKGMAAPQVPDISALRAALNK